MKKNKNMETRTRLIFSIIEQFVLPVLIVLEPFVFPFFYNNADPLKSVVTLLFMILLFGFGIQNGFTIFNLIKKLIKNKRKK